MAQYPVCENALTAAQCAGSNAGDVERYSDRFNAKKQGLRPPLASVMTLDPNYFPDELYTTKQKECVQSAVHLVAARLQACPGPAQWFRRKAWNGCLICFCGLQVVCACFIVKGAESILEVAGTDGWGRCVHAVF